MEINRAFNGKLNLDAAAYRMPPSDYIDALNITKDAQLGSNDRVVSNIVGNRLVDYTLPDGINKEIGRKEDIVRNRIYYMIWNSNDFHLILYYDKTNDEIIKLLANLTDTDGIDILQFNPSWRINHIDIIYRDEGDLISFTDGYTSPKEINETFLANGTYPIVKLQFIEKAKRPPLTSPLCVYGSDTNRNANALRRKLFQFSYYWGYDNFEESTFSTYSKIPLPIGYYGSDNDIDNTSNNFISITVDTGDENVRKIFIAMRNNIGDAWGDFVQIAAVDKDDLGIPDNSTYGFLFYNDNVYPPITTGGVQYTDGVQTIQLFDWCPRTAFTQCLPNGNVINYGAITEGYNNYPQNLLDVTITAENVTNIPPDSDPPAINYSQLGTLYTFTVSGEVPVGTVYTIRAVIGGIPPLTQITLAQYTALPGDTIDDVALGLFTYTSVNHPAYAGGIVANVITYIMPSNSFVIIHIDTGGGSGSEISTEKTWLWDANYIYGIVYVDEQNRDMPGVTTYANPTNVDNDFLVTTPSFSLDGTSVQTPVINAEINHLPPVGAVRYYWVRRRLTYGTFMMYETCDFLNDPDSDGFLYFCLANIEAYKAANSQFIYGTAPISDESRIKIIAAIASSDYNGTLYTEDYQILSTVLKQPTSGGDDVSFIKVKKPDGSLSNPYTANMLVMIYTPALNPTTLADSGFWEWGEGYDIYELSGVNYHRGMNQDQTSLQPATFTWAEGDVYFHQRTMYNEVPSTSANQDTVDIMDANFSDFFDSSVNDNGRAQVIEVNAKETYYPTLDRFSREFQSGTTINQTNRFFFENLDEYDRSFGDIRKMYIEGRCMYVIQKFDIGVVPILTQIVRDVSGNPLEANSDRLLNKITYPYVGKIGIGDVPESFAADKYAKYGVDSNKGVAWRLSVDGIIVLSVLYQCNSFFVDKLAAYKKDLNNGNPNPDGIYTGDATVCGVFDSFTNKYIIALEEINRYAGTNSLVYYLFDIALDDILFFPAITPENNITIEVLMSATNGDEQTLTYDIPDGISTVTLRANLVAAINATVGTLFSAVIFDDLILPQTPPLPDVPLYGVRVSDIAGFGVTLTVTLTGRLIFHQDPETIAFLETRDASEGFESMYSYHPEGMASLNNLLVSFKDGELWKHDNPVYCNFYGVQYDSFVTGVFNDNPLAKKTFVALMSTANRVWACPEIETQLMSYGTTPQESELITEDFDIMEGQYYAAFKQDSNSIGGLIEGDNLKGNYIVVKFIVEDASDFVYLNTVSVHYINSALNSK